ncbi:unnamed protein product [Chrysoparadoxa australica]
MAQEKQAIKDLEARFEAKYGSKPDFCVQAPGRVNLIGEHIDYSGYGVMPMALELNVMMAAQLPKDSSGSESMLHLANTEPNFPCRRCPSSPSSPLGYDGGDEGAHDWSGYFQCGYKGVMDLAAARGVETGNGLPGLKVMVHGTIPPGGGLSSSSAMVVASALVTITAMGLTVSPNDMASLCIESERYIGVMSGGMDQAASCCSEAGKALHVEFEPKLHTEAVALPTEALFVVCNSHTKAEKAVSALHHYNLRVLECKLAARLLGKLLGVEDWHTLPNLSRLHQAMQGASLEDMAEHCKGKLDKGGYTISQLTEALGDHPSNLSLFGQGEELDERANKVLQANERFYLQERAIHVFEEAQRVLSFKGICLDKNLSKGNRLSSLGSLMEGSHASCRDMFDCSCPELERLVEAAKSAGAFGSRLTGAGWGGCTVSLVKRGEEAAFVKAVKSKFYGERFREGDILVSQPAPGAGAWQC